MKLITGFFMAWGNFLTLPCPLKKWDNDLKNYMLGFLPSVGLIVGLLWALLCLLMVWLAIPFLVMCFLLTLIPFALCGFMHLDGFMDCSDAILSRKPLEEKQKILKDSHTGAFAVVSVVFLLLGFHAFLSTAISQGLDFINLCMLPIMSRGISGIHVLCCKPIGHSQYAQGFGASDQKQKKKALIMLLLQLVLYCGIGLWFSANVTTSLFLLGAVILASCLAILFARCQLGGMSGDIAGYGIVWGELIGILTLALI